ncbi:hypothetical protein ACP70R_000572 [Stipagrostis hirtigluma subsp. patula]
MTGPNSSNTAADHPAGGVPPHVLLDPPALMAADAVCGWCRMQLALLHCAQHAGRFCLPCDVVAHAIERRHERAPLCDGCQAAPAAARCHDHQASLCAACARAAGCDGGRHSRRPVRACTGFPEPDDLWRILSGGTPPPPTRGSRI